MFRSDQVKGVHETIHKKVSQSPPNYVHINNMILTLICSVVSPVSVSASWICPEYFFPIPLIPEIQGCKCGTLSSTKHPPARRAFMLFRIHILPFGGRPLLISERAKRASSVMFVFNRDFRYVRIYIYLLRTPPSCSVEINVFELG